MQNDEQAGANRREAEDMYASFVDRLNRTRPQLSIDRDETKNEVRLTKERRQMSGE
jgi:hypothetical protein